MSASWVRRAVVLLCAGSLAACYNRNDITAPNDILAVSAQPASIAADGVSTTRLVAKVSAQIDRDLVVAFTASAGTVVANGTSPDANGEVSATLRSTTVPQSVLVTATISRGAVVQASRTIPVTFGPVETSTLVRLALSNPVLEADGASTIQVRVEINPSISPRTVKFETTAGSFAATTNTLVRDNVPTSADGVATLLLYAPQQLGSALVTVTAGGFSASDTVTFVRALPEAITLGATPLALPRSETQFTTVTAALTRALGKVTQGTRVDFSITNDDSGQSFGRFQRIEGTNADGTATAQFVPGTTAPLGLATIRARVADNGLSATVKITITP